MRDMLRVVLVNPRDVALPGLHVTRVSQRRRVGSLPVHAQSGDRCNPPRPEQGGICQQPLRIYSSLENPLIPLRAPRGFCFPLQTPS